MDGHDRSGHHKRDGGRDYDLYALDLGFSRGFAIAFPWILDAVIIVLAVTLLLECALGRRTMSVLGWRFNVRLPTWPMISL